MSNFFTNLFSTGATELVGTIGGVIDSLVTSDEERLTLKNALEKEIMDHSERQEDQALKHEHEITERHKNDMNSDSWLSKNVRPMALIFLTIMTVALAYFTIFSLDDVKKLSLITPWIELLTTLLVIVYVFYFGSRGMEKIQKIKKAK